MNKKGILITVLLIFTSLVLFGCGISTLLSTADRESSSGTQQEKKTGREEVTQQTESTRGKIETGEETTTEFFEADTETKAPAKARKKKVKPGAVIAIDAGHQAHQNSDTEPIGPGASEEKMKVTSGTSGVSTGKEEYELTLEVSLKLRDRLKGLGYKVVMVRETNDVDISNSERASIANDAHADVFIRIHANADDDSDVNGILTICQTPDNPFNGDLYRQSRLLSDCILDNTVRTTGAKKLYVWETDTMSGINWAKVPTTILEMGFMSNPHEDEQMATDSYQELIIDGIVDGIKEYLKKTKKN